MARIATSEALRRIIAEPRAATRSKILDALDEQSIDFLGRCPFALVGTISADGTLEVSPKGDEPGFIRVEDPRTLLIPERIGNNLAFGLGNIVANGKIGLIALVPATGEMLRISGTAAIYDDADLVGSLGSLGKPALLATRVRIKHCYFHCARSIVRQTVGSQGVAGAGPRLVRQDHRAQDRRRRRRGGADRRQCRGRLHDPSMVEYAVESFRRRPNHASSGPSPDSPGRQPPIQIAARASRNETRQRRRSSQSVSRTQRKLSSSVTRPTAFSSGWSRSTRGSR